MGMSMLKLDGQVKRFAAAQKLGQDGGYVQEVQFVIVAKMTDDNIAELARLQRDGQVVVQMETKQLDMGLFSGRGANGNAEVQDKAS